MARIFKRIKILFTISYALLKSDELISNTSILCFSSFQRWHDTFEYPRTHSTLAIIIYHCCQKSVLRKVGVKFTWKWNSSEKRRRPKISKCIKHWNCYFEERKKKVVALFWLFFSWMLLNSPCLWWLPCIFHKLCQPENKNKKNNRLNLE